MAVKDRVLYQWDNVRVSSTRLVVSERSYAIASVLSVRRAASKSSLSPAAVAVASGVLFGAAGIIGRNEVNSAIGLIFLAAAAWLVVRRKTTHHVVVTTGSGEARVLSSANRHFVESVILAVEEARRADLEARRPGVTGARPDGPHRVAVEDLKRESEAGCRIEAATSRVEAGGAVLILPRL